MTRKPPLKIVPESPPHPTDPPRQLGDHGRQFWRLVTSEYDIVDSGGREILMQCCAALDRAEALRSQIDADGEVLRVKGGVKSHPALRDELACRAFITRSIARLGLDVEPIRAGAGRPPGSYTVR
jgi:hypothetical protein